LPASEGRRAPHMWVRRRSPRKSSKCRSRLVGMWPGAESEIINGWGGKRPAGGSIFGEKASKRRARGGQPHRAQRKALHRHSTSLWAGSWSYKLSGDFVAAGFAAGLAVVEAVVAEADVELPLAEDAVFLAFTAFFSLFADAAAGFDFGGHGGSVAPLLGWGR